MYQSLPPDFSDRPFWQRRWIDLLVLLHLKPVKAVCCESFRTKGRACKGCATLYHKKSMNPWYRFLGYAAKRLPSMTVVPQLITLAEDLVRTRIPGNRKGMEKPAYEHSFHVRSLLADAGMSKEVCLAGLLHDIVEDGEVTLEMLRELKFPERVIALVDLCSHSPIIEGGDARWMCMMARLIEAADADAWSIKLADLTSNIGDAHAMSEDRRQWMYTVKAPMMLRVTKPLMGQTTLWKNLEKALEGARG